MHEIINIYSPDWQLTAVLDTYKSLIWTTRYYNCGDFEMIIPADKNLLPAILPGYFAMRNNSNEAMIIESFEINTDVEHGDFFTIKGRSLLSILDRRITWNLTVEYIDETPSAVILNLVHDNITPDRTSQTFSRYSPVQRYIHGFTLVNNAADMPELMSLQTFGESLLTRVSEIAKTYELGIRVTVDPTAEAPYTFEVYRKNRRDSLIDVSLNLLTTKFSVDLSSYANMAMVAGFGSEHNRWLQTSYLDAEEPTGFNRREVYVDATNKNPLDESGNYNKVLKATGKHELSNHKKTRIFEATTDSKLNLEIGDVVTVSNEYGMRSLKARVTEIIESWTAEEGYTVNTSFSAWKEEE